MAMRAPRALYGALNVELSYRWKKLPTPMRGHYVGVWAALHFAIVFDGSAVTAAGDAVPASARAHDVVLVVCSRELHVLAARDEARRAQIAFADIVSVDVVGKAQLAALALPDGAPDGAPKGAGGGGGARSGATHAVEVCAAGGIDYVFCVASVRAKQELYATLIGLVRLEREKLSRVAAARS